MSTHLRDVPRPVEAHGSTSVGWAVDAGQIGGGERQRLAPGVALVELWSGGGSHAGVMWLEPYAELDEHTHRRHAHHVWVAEGVVDALGRRLGPGS
jgi:hypothetical protein